MAEYTEKFGTETADGWYDHAKINLGGVGDHKVTTIMAPVKLDFSQRYENGYKPLRRGNKVVYALPGGGEIELDDPGPTV